MKKVGGLHLHQDSVEDLLIQRKEEGSQSLQVTGVCLGELTLVRREEGGNTLLG